MSEFRATVGSVPLSSLLETLSRRPVRLAAARLTPEEASIAAVGAPLPSVFSRGRPVPFPSAREGRVLTASAPLTAGDIVFTVSHGLESMLGAGTHGVDEQLQRAARLAEQDTLSAAFTDLVSRWKGEGRRPGDRDVVILGARKA
jgi:hypothetical protein